MCVLIKGLWKKYCNIQTVEEIKVIKRAMAVDLRQVMAAFLTFSMFMMLGNMIKKDHIDPFLEPLPASPIIKYSKFSRPEEHRQLIEVSNDLWMDKNEPSKPCWRKPSSKGKVESKGYVFFSLTHGPEFHAIQVANAVAVARHLGATLAIPDIIGTTLGGKRHFGDIYDVDNFITSLNGVVQVDKNPPPALPNAKLPIVKIPNRVTKAFISSKIEPIFAKTRSLRISTYSNGSSTYARKKDNKLTNDYLCMAMYESLKLQPDLHDVVGSMVGTLRSLSQKSQGRFVVVDLKVDVLERMFCRRRSDVVGKSCYNAEEIGGFLKRIGFGKETTIYLTQRGWHHSLNGLRNIFPNTFTKDAIMAADQRATFMMDSESEEYEKLMDFQMCTEGDVFVPAYPSRFYASVVGKRIADGTTRILLPSNNNVSAFSSDYTSPYIAKRSHFAYSCFC